MNRKRDFSKIVTKAHENKWGAFSSDYRRVVGSASALSTLRKEIGKKKVVYMKVPRMDTYHAFYSVCA